MANTIKTALKNTASKNIELTVLNQKVVLKSDADPEHVEKVTKLVQEHITQAEKRLKGVNAPHLVMVLALMDMAEEHLSSKQNIKQKTLKLTEFLQSELFSH